MNLDFKVSFDTSILERKLDNGLKKVLFVSMNKMETLAKQRCPVDTNRLRQSITLHPKVYGSKVYTLSDGVDYGVFVEYGTKSMEDAHGKHDPRNPITDWEAKRKRGASGQTLPFFRPALLEVKEVWLPRYFDKYIYSK